MNRPLILPPLRRTEADAFRFARAVHANQVDKAGKPYLGHLDRVHAGLVKLAAGCPFWGAREVDEAEQVAWLHEIMLEAAAHLAGTAGGSGAGLN